MRIFRTISCHRTGACLLRSVFYSCRKQSCIQAEARPEHGERGAGKDEQIVNIPFCTAKPLVVFHSLLTGNNVLPPQSAGRQPRPLTKLYRYLGETAGFAQSIFLTRRPAE